MKKTIIVVLVVILTAGLGFGIYYIFAGRNIKFVQLQGFNANSLFCRRCCTRF